MESPYKTKKYHYNYRHPDELSEENLRKTFINMSSKAFVENMDKTVRQENMNFDAMQSKERKEAMYKLQLQLEKLSAVPDEDSGFFSDLKQGPIGSQFNMWKKNMYVPLTDQLKEQAERKVR